MLLLARRFFFSSYASHSGTETVISLNYATIAGDLTNEQSDYARCAIIPMKIGVHAAAARLNEKLDMSKVGYADKLSGKILLILRGLGLPGSFNYSDDVDSSSQTAKSPRSIDRSCKHGGVPKKTRRNFHFLFLSSFQCATGTFYCVGILSPSYKNERWLINYVREEI